MVKKKLAAIGLSAVMVMSPMAPMMSVAYAAELTTLEEEVETPNTEVPDEIKGVKALYGNVLEEVTFDITSIVKDETVSNIEKITIVGVDFEVETAKSDVGVTLEEDGSSGIIKVKEKTVRTIGEGIVAAIKKIDKKKFEIYPMPSKPIDVFISENNIVTIKALDKNTVITANNLTIDIHFESDPQESVGTVEGKIKKLFDGVAFDFSNITEENVEQIGKIIIGGTTFKVENNKEATEEVKVSNGTITVKGLTFDNIKKGIILAIPEVEDKNNIITGAENFEIEYYGNNRILVTSDNGTNIGEYATIIFKKTQPEIVIEEGGVTTNEAKIEKKEDKEDNYVLNKAGNVNIQFKVENLKGATVTVNGEQKTVEEGSPYETNIEVNNESAITLEIKVGAEDEVIKTLSFEVEAPVKNEQEEATCTENGVVAYWTWNGKAYSKEDLNEEIANIENWKENEGKIDALDHNYEDQNVEYTWEEVESGYKCVATQKCWHCGYERSTEAEVTQEESDEKTIYTANFVEVWAEQMNKEVEKEIEVTIPEGDKYAVEGDKVYTTVDGEVQELEGKKFVKAGTDWYMTRIDGTVERNCMRKWTDNEWYLFRPDGTMVANKMRQHKNKWFLMRPDGTMVANKMRRYKNKWYLFDANGYMFANTVKTYKGITYTIDANGYCHW